MGVSSCFDITRTDHHCTKKPSLTNGILMYGLQALHKDIDLEIAGPCAQRMLPITYAKTVSIHA